MWARLRVTKQLQIDAPASSVFLATAIQTYPRADTYVWCAPKPSNKRSRTAAGISTVVHDHLSIIQPDPGVPNGSHRRAGWSPELLVSLRVGSPFRCLTLGEHSFPRNQHLAEIGDMLLHPSMKDRQQKFHVSSLPEAFSTVLRQHEVVPRKAPAEVAFQQNDYTVVRCPSASHHQARIHARYGCAELSEENLPSY